MADRTEPAAGREGSPLGGLAATALRHPSLVPHLLRAAWVFRARGWWRRPPFLPLPSRAYLRWRMETAYGDPTATPPPEDVLRYLRWAADLRRRM